MYFGILFGQLVVPRRPKTIETLEELVNQDQVEWGVTVGTVMYDLFKQSAPDTIYGRVAKRMHNISTADDGIKHVIGSNWAYIRERSMLIFKVSYNSNSLILLSLLTSLYKYMNTHSKHVKPFVLF